MQVPQGFYDSWISGRITMLPLTSGARIKSKIKSKTSLKLRSHNVSFDHRFFRSWWIPLKFCSQSGFHIAMLSATIQKDSSTMKDVAIKRDFAKFHFMAYLVLCIITGPQGLMECIRRGYVNVKLLV